MSSPGWVVARPGCVAGSLSLGARVGVGRRRGAGECGRMVVLAQAGVVSRVIVSARAGVGVVTRSTFARAVGTRRHHAGCRRRRCARGVWAARSSSFAWGCVAGSLLLRAGEGGEL